ncbi:DUF1648 domain-containing protein [Ethanoligenens harbinense]|uniref:DUF1648 domain-containing protein n=1 Tax=Ethanoligenens harbinense (strain DSM 18485 / JCM 12961 / CGMCC 1.5033 / YUAN-3) TaxID=663278 RepID=E6U8Y1_ETHHY|nr:DUF1648 domain-containing protein [Ethanoligenens harbinense]ADU26045.1 protein of unknown function DUF1648 [Ethanoligenens harbinense YUAN-3]
MKTKYTRLQTVLEIVNILLLIAQFVYVLSLWSRLPARIPAHFDAAGHINRYGSKNELFIVPFVTVGMYASLLWLQRFPQNWNTSVEVTERSRAYVYSATKTILVLCRTCVAVTFFIITICISARQITWIWLDCIPVAALVVFIVLYSGRIKRRADKLNHPYG